jgi:hypothetical protein
MEATESFMISVVEILDRRILKGIPFEETPKPIGIYTVLSDKNRVLSLLMSSKALSVDQYQVRLSFLLM